MWIPPPDFLNGEVDDAAGPPLVDPDDDVMSTDDDSVDIQVADSHQLRHVYDLCCNLNERYVLSDEPVDTTTLTKSKATPVPRETKKKKMGT